MSACVLWCNTQANKQTNRGMDWGRRVLTAAASTPWQGVRAIILAVATNHSSLPLRSHSTLPHALALSSSWAVGSTSDGVGVSEGHAWYLRQRTMNGNTTPARTGQSTALAEYVVWTQLVCHAADIQFSEAVEGCKHSLDGCGGTG